MAIKLSKLQFSNNAHYDLRKKSMDDFSAMGTTKY
jgi:hypothetical protein